MTKTAAATGTGCGAAAPGAGPAAGLVSSKTSREAPCFINFSPSAVAERRVKRLKKSVWASGHLHGFADKGHRPPVAWFVTLTYDTQGTLGNGKHDWAAHHMSRTIDRFRNWCRSFGIPCRYTWVAELQTRGAVHYHMLVWLPVGCTMPKWDKWHKLASGVTRPPFWPYGMSNTQTSTAGVGYLMKYLSKLGELTRFPKGLRLYGIGGLTEQARSVRSWLNLPEWVKAAHGVGDVVRKKIGLLVKATGELLEPAFSVRHVPSGVEIVPLRALAARFHDGAYSTFPRP